MKYLKNIEVAEMYKVSEDTITNWIKAAKQKKISLQVVEGGKRSYIVNTPFNHLQLKELAEKGKKYKNRRALKDVYPTKEFYSVYNETQIIELISYLEIYKEFPHKYTYFNGGAEYWDNYVKRTFDDSLVNTVTNARELLELNRDYIFSLVGGSQKVNVIDIGVGNAYPIKDLLATLHSKGILNKYIAIDLSEKMLEIAEYHIHEWFDGQIKFETYIADISNNSIRDLLFKNTQYFENQGVINLVCFLGSTIENMEVTDHSLENIKKSLGAEDFFILGRTLDTNESKIYFDFYEKKPEEYNEDDPEQRKWKWFIDVIGISDDLYSYEMVYNSEIKSRIGQMSLNSDINIVFETPNFRKVVSFNKHDKIVTWRHRHHSYREIVDDMSENSFQILHTSTSKDRSQIMLVTKLQRI